MLLGKRIYTPDENRKQLFNFPHKQAGRRCSYKLAPSSTLTRTDPNSGRFVLFFSSTHLAQLKVFRH